jgi:hypothetical protein
MGPEELAVDRAIYLVDRERCTYRYGRRNPGWRQLTAAENERNKRSLDGYTRVFPDGRTAVFHWPR